MKKYILLILILSFQISFCQDRFYFYLELSDIQMAPTVTNNTDGTLNIFFENQEIDEIFNNYILYKFERIAPNASLENLKKTFSVECNDIDLMHEIRTRFSNIFIMAEEYTLPLDNGILYMPNDYNTFQPQANYQAKHLDMINAQQAWDITHGSNDVKIGIIDTGIRTTHEEFINKNVTILGLNTPHSHGTGVSGLAAGDTDNNGLGFSSIGFNSGLIFTSGTGFSGMELLDDIANAGAKVINGSWYTTINNNGGTPLQSHQTMIDNLYNMNVVVVIAAGNGPQSGIAPTIINAENYSNRYYYPASYKNVISVSTVGNWNDIGSTIEPFDHWKNIHKVKTPFNVNYSGTNIPISETEIFHQHNDSVDIVVPAYKVPVIGSWQNNAYWYSSDQGGISGTSFSAPIVTGTIGLMFSVNYCLKPKEVESILKLTAIDIENLPDNIEFYGRLGGGALDAFRAVEMANEMAKPFGTVIVKDRKLYRDWFYKLETAPYEIKMSDNLITYGAKIKFFARDNIEILSGDYQPITGYMDLQINENLELNCETPFMTEIEKKSNKPTNKNEIKLYPNPTKSNITIDLGVFTNEVTKISIFDVFGREILKSSQNKSNFIIDVSSLPSGTYIVKVENKEINEILKFMKD